MTLYFNANYNHFCHSTKRWSLEGYMSLSAGRTGAGLQIYPGAYMFQPAPVCLNYSETGCRDIRNVWRYSVPLANCIAVDRYSQWCSAAFADLPQIGREDRRQFEETSSCLVSVALNSLFSHHYSVTCFAFLCRPTRTKWNRFHDSSCHIHNSFPVSCRKLWSIIS